VWEVIADDFLGVVVIVALDVLPRIAFLAIDGISVIVSETTYTLDGVWLFLYRLLFANDMLDGRVCRERERGLTGRCELRRQWR